MSDIHTEVEAPAAPKPKAKRKHRKRRKAATRITEQAVEFEGMTATKCCDDCREGHCIITETRFCGHPYKSNQNHAPAPILERILRARKRIAHLKVDLRNA